MILLFKIIDQLDNIRKNTEKMCNILENKPLTMAKPDMFVRNMKMKMREMNAENIREKQGEE